MICIIYFLLMFQNITAQNYFPLKVGNKFIYNCNESSWVGDMNINETYKIKISIKKDTIILGRKYYFREMKSYFSTYTDLVRVDSITGSLYKYDTTNNCPKYYYENLIDSLSIAYGHVLLYCPNYGYDFLMQGADSTTLFGYVTFNKSFNFQPNPHITIINRYNSKFGYIYYHFYGSTGGHGSSTSQTIIGCVINDTLYGDTTMTVINNLSKNIPVDVSLYQNYPNPFNPATKIKFDITRNRINHYSKESYVRLKIYNVLGREIQTLVNEKLFPGTYEVTFNGGNLESGIYFYQLSSGYYTVTKKMVLIK
jgi:hypothetical protein